MGRRPFEGMEIWQNGRVVSSSPSSVPAWTKVNSRFVLGKPVIQTGDPAFDGDLGEHSFLYVYNRVLTPDEIKELSADPFDMFPRRLVFKPFFVEVMNGGLGISGQSVQPIPSIATTGGARLGGGSVTPYGVQSIKGSAGARLAGHGSVSYTAVGNGGTVAGGKAINGKPYRNTATGGARPGGSASLSTVVGGSGGARPGGSAKLNVFQGIKGAAGALASGHGRLIETAVATGGIKGGGVGIDGIKGSPTARAVPWRAVRRS